MVSSDNRMVNQSGWHCAGREGMDWNRGHGEYGGDSAVLRCFAALFAPQK